MPPLLREMEASRYMITARMAVCGLWRRSVHADVRAKGGNFKWTYFCFERICGEGTGEVRCKAGSGFTGCDEEGVPLEDGISGGARAADPRVPEMDSGRACADSGDCGRDRAAFSWQRERNTVAARRCGLVCVSPEYSVWCNGA